MRTRSLSFLTLLLVGVVTACSGTSNTNAPTTTQQFTSDLFPSFLLWLPTADGAPGGSNGTSGDAIITTVPFNASAAGGASDAGALRNQAAFFLVADAASPSQLGTVRSLPVSWSVGGNVAVVASAPPVTPPPGATAGIGSLPSTYVSGTNPGVGTLTVTVANAPVPISDSVKVFTYPVVDVGCRDTGALPGASFATDGSYAASTGLVAAGDLYVTGPNCATVFNDFSGASTIHTPYGATLISTGEVALTSGSVLSNEGTLNFTQIAPSTWKSDFTSIDAATFEADVNPPCNATMATPFPLPSSYPNPLPTISGCASTPDDVLVLKTSTGAIVKMYIALDHDGQTSGNNVLGAYEVTNASGAFPY